MTSERMTINGHLVTFDVIVLCCVHVMESELWEWWFYIAVSCSIITASFDESRKENIKWHASG
jgi:hypothetical protein